MLLCGGSTLIQWRVPLYKELLVTIWSFSVNLVSLFVSLFPFVLQGEKKLNGTKAIHLLLGRDRVCPNHEGIIFSIITSPFELDLFSL